jgi:hypothetical protein
VAPSADKPLDVEHEAIIIQASRVMKNRCIVYRLLVPQATTVSPNRAESQRQPLGRLPVGRWIDRLGVLSRERDRRSTLGSSKSPRGGRTSGNALAPKLIRGTTAARPHPSADEVLTHLDCSWWKLCRRRTLHGSTSVSLQLPVLDAYVTRAEIGVAFFDRKSKSNLQQSREYMVSTTHPRSTMC